MSFLIFSCSNDSASDLTDNNEDNNESIPDLVTFNQNILPIIQNSCTPCHGPNGSQPDYTNFRNASDNATDISDRVNRTPGSPGFMPEGQLVRLSQRNLDLIAKWITDGKVEQP